MKVNDNKGCLSQKTSKQARAGGTAQKQSQSIPRFPPITKRTFLGVPWQLFVWSRETSKIKNPSINGHKDDAIPGAEAELKVERHAPGRVFVLQNRVNTTFQSVTLMICDWRRLRAQIQLGKFSGFLCFLFVFCSFHILLVLLTRLAAWHKDRCCRYRIKSGFFCKQMDFIYININK